MKTIVTLTGLALLQEKLKEKKDILKNIREEKAHAYSASGDGWHDNPGWTQLGQQEDMFAHEVRLLERKISNAVLIDSSRMNLEKVQIGSKVTFIITRNKSSSAASQTIYIVGAGETDVKNQRISYDSPMGKALYNMLKGDVKEVVLPIGIITVKVEEISYE